MILDTYLEYDVARVFWSTFLSPNSNCKLTVLYTPNVSIFHKQVFQSGVALTFLLSCSILYASAFLQRNYCKTVYRKDRVL
ncbi:hypothetical protein L211DRAFT_400945 [Terfezia boudieri ATCC MYA-4762]|uniref:Uncharacterized protein n=1 Tax=Terfezia boudieri ATCC MYA-4762 TaxID=1051890 RepID=A0A3N4M6R7_9PEZI|nr:hypothetical protein L211DRAFT_400945 [Terfezia boudieri ATCC MYA-4762]